MEGTISLGSASRASWSPNSNKLRETGDRLARHSPHETMNCPNCRTPMEDGLIDKTCWFSRPPSTALLRIYRALLSITAWCAVHRLIAHRCPSCHRVELTSP